MENKKRLIDANAFQESIEGIDWYTIRVDGSATQGAPSEEVAWYKATDIYVAIENAPTVDAVEVVHGHWISRGYKIECSVCGHRSFLGTHDPVIHTEEKSICKYCHNCGAKMDGERKDNDNK